MGRWLMVLGLVLALAWGMLPAEAGTLGDRLAAYPDWLGLPPTSVARGDLAYPAWFEGSWQATTTLVDLRSPLAPELVTPGFEANRQSLNQPVMFDVRFLPAHPAKLRGPGFKVPEFKVPEFKGLGFQSGAGPAVPIVADRALNGLNIAQAYLGEMAVRSVTVAPDNPNQQLTTLSNGHQLVSLITGRASEMPNDSTFLTSEVFQQVFRGSGLPYLNRVETTTAYHRTPEQAIAADQITAIYLSPQDPNYFKAGDRPVALYRYQLNLIPRTYPTPP